MSLNFEGLARSLLADADHLLEQWLPGGRFNGHEYICAGLLGGHGRSLSVNRMTGQWADFSDEGTKGGDLISLYAAINHKTQREAYIELGGDTKPSGDARPPRAEIEMHPPPQTDFEPSMFKHHKLGTPAQFWIYRDAQASALFAVARYDKGNGEKEILPWIWTGLVWRNKGPPKPRPLYGLDRLANSDKRVLLVEGEKTADAAQHLFPGRPCVTWMGGVGQVGVADLAPLAGREVTIWPDNDEPGIKAAATLAGKLMASGCAVWVVDPSGWPAHWDLADALESGVPKADLIDYVKTHTKALERPAEKPARKDVERLQTVASGELIENKGTPSIFQVWEQYQFARKGNGKPYANPQNVALAIDVHGELGIYYDDFSQRIVSSRGEWTGDNDLYLMGYMQEQLGIPEVSPKTVYDGVRLYALRHRRNPVQEFFSGLHWDGVERLGELLPVGMGTKDSDYTRAVGRCFLVGIVARAMRPGCKADCMPVFEGPQGAFKSTALKILGGDYFAEIHESINSKDFYIATQGKLICEISELHAFKRAEIEKIKGILSTSTDRYRAPYDRAAADHPRSCVFAGTTNLDDWNTDETGARRFWPVRCGRIDREWLETHRLQLLAEAHSAFVRGVDWWSVPESEANLQRHARRSVDPWEGKIAYYLEGRDSVDTELILSNCIDMDIQDVNKTHSNRVGAILRALGFETRALRVDGKVVRKWVRKG